MFRKIIANRIRAGLLTKVEEANLAGEIGTLRLQVAQTFLAELAAQGILQSSCGQNQRSLEIARDFLDLMEVSFLRESRSYSGEDVKTTCQFLSMLVQEYLPKKTNIVNVARGLLGLIRMMHERHPTDNEEAAYGNIENADEISARRRSDDLSLNEKIRKLMKLRVTENTRSPEALSEITRMKYLHATLVKAKRSVQGTAEYTKFVQERNRLIQGSLDVVDYSAYRYGKGDPDLIQTGILALMYATINFNPAKGKLSTHAKPEVMRSMATQGMLDFCTISLDSPWGLSDGLTLLEKERSLSDDDHPFNVVWETMLAESVEKALSACSPKEKETIESRYGVSGQSTKTLKEIGGVLGLRPSRVQQIEKLTLRKLLKRCPLLKAYWVDLKDK